MDSKHTDINNRKQQATPRGVGIMCSWYVERAENATLWDMDGREYTDFAGGIAVLNTGHRHPKVIAAVTEQLGKFTHTAYRVAPYESYVSLAERINQRAPIEGPAKQLYHRCRSCRKCGQNCPGCHWSLWHYHI